MALEGVSGLELSRCIADRVGGTSARWARYLTRILAGQIFVSAEVADVICVAGLYKHPSAVWGHGWNAAAPEVCGLSISWSVDQGYVA
jgi:hypothetical protein